MSTYRLDSIEMPDGNDYEIPIFIAEYGVTTYEEIMAEYSAGKLIFCLKDGSVLPLNYLEDGTEPVFQRPARGCVYAAVCNTNGEWAFEALSLYTKPAATRTSLTGYYLAIASGTGNVDRANISFGSSTTQYLANNGTWQNLPSIPSTAADVGAIAAPSSPATGSFLVWNGSAWTAQTLSTWQGGNY